MKILFIDSETNGLPTNRWAPFTSTEMWPHVIQLSWQIIDTNTWAVLKTENHYLKPRAIWNKDAERVHRIPESIASEKGKDPAEVLAILHSDLQTSQCIVAHNLVFDKTAILAEVQRGWESGKIQTQPSQFWKNVKELCTMTTTKQFVGIKFPNSNDIKFPRLDELYNKLFNKPYDISGAELHNANNDVSCLVMCYRELYNRDEFANVIQK